MLTTVKVKTNLGHSEAVSAIAGLMKVILALERGSIPPSVGVTRLNPNSKLWHTHRNILGGAPS